MLVEVEAGRLVNIISMRVKAVVCDRFGFPDVLMVRAFKAIP